MTSDASCRNGEAAGVSTAASAFRAALCATLLAIALAAPLQALQPLGHAAGFGGALPAPTPADR